MKNTKIKAVRELTGASTYTIKHFMNMFPKANIQKLVEIIREETLAVYHKIPVQERYKHLR